MPRGRAICNKCGDVYLYFLRACPTCYKRQNGHINMLRCKICNSRFSELLPYCPHCKKETETIIDNTGFEVPDQQNQNQN